MLSMAWRQTVTVASDRQWLLLSAPKLPRTAHSGSWRHACWVAGTAPINLASQVIIVKKIKMPL